VGRAGIAALTLALAGVLATAAAGAGAAVTVAEASKRFKAASGFALVKKAGASYPGHYVALDTGAPSITKSARFGTFTLFVVTGPDVAGEVRDLLADTHTGALGRPDARGIHWEPGRTLSGTRYWLAKKRYGANLVLWWYGPAVRKTDAAFARLHGVLRKSVVG
jgi:hypothetical protein